MKDVLKAVMARRVVPVVTIDDARDALPLADALIAGGLPVAEITLRTPAALQAIANIAGRGDLLVGAGTVLTMGQVRQALDAGAQFIVSPGFNQSMVQFCRDLRIPVLPGVCTPTDIQLALDYGLNQLKYFPAEAFGGVSTLTAVSSPYPEVRFMPTGGINADNLASYLRLPQVTACGGSWMVERKLIRERQFDEIRANIIAAAQIVAQVEEKSA
jgi:2-dehydro-3-deoxyphosphogluconate aldolase/(4S)-4-hydroxy-2-oxoglutarate aldolase